MSFSFRHKFRELRRASLTLERLEGRQLLATIAVPSISVPSLQPAAMAPRHRYNRQGITARLPRQRHLRPPLPRGIRCP